MSRLLFSPSQAGAGLRLAGLCLWTDPSGGVHVDLHVPFRVGGSLHSFPPVVTDPVRESQPPQVVECPLCLHLPALPILCSGIPAYLHRSDQQSATCFPLHCHHGTGPWPDCYKYLSLFKKTCSIYFWISVGNVAKCLFIRLTSGAPDDESPLLHQGECTEGPDLGQRQNRYENSSFHPCSLLLGGSHAFIFYRVFLKLMTTSLSSRLQAHLQCCLRFPSICTSSLPPPSFTETSTHGISTPSRWLKQAVLKQQFMLISLFLIKYRNPVIRWGYVATKLLQVLTACFIWVYWGVQTKPFISVSTPHLKGPGQSVLCLLRFRAAVHPSVPQHQPAANGPEGHRPLHL